MAADADILELIAQVKVEGNFDQADDVVLRWLSRRHQVMCARSRCFRSGGDSSDLPGGTSEFPVGTIYPPNVDSTAIVELMEFGVNGLPWGKVDHPTFQKALAGMAVLRGAGGIWTNIDGPTDGAGAGEVITWFPVPEDAFTVNLRAALTPMKLNLFDHDSDALSQIKVPVQYLDGLVAGAIATGLARTEQRPDLASSMNAEFDAACEELRRHVNRKYRGSQPATIRVVGYDA